MSISKNIVSLLSDRSIVRDRKDYVIYEDQGSLAWLDLAEKLNIQPIGKERSKWEKDIRAVKNNIPSRIEMFLTSMLTPSGRLFRGLFPISVRRKLSQSLILEEIPFVPYIKSNAGVQDRAESYVSYLHALYDGIPYVDVFNNIKSEMNPLYMRRRQAVLNACLLYRKLLEAGAITRGQKLNVNEAFVPSDVWALTGRFPSGKKMSVEEQAAHMQKMVADYIARGGKLQEDEEEIETPEPNVAAKQKKKVGLWQRIAKRFGKKEDKQADTVVVTRTTEVVWAPWFLRIVNSFMKDWNHTKGVVEAKLQKIKNWLNPFKVKPVAPKETIEEKKPTVPEQSQENDATQQRKELVQKLELILENRAKVLSTERSLEQVPDLSRLGNPKRLIGVLDPLIDELRMKTVLTDHEMGEIALMSHIVNGYGSGKIKCLNNFYITDRFQLEVARSVAKKLQEKGINVPLKERKIKVSSDTRVKIRKWRIDLEKRNRQRQADASNGSAPIQNSLGR